jgi:hypothetical protein
MYPERRTAAKPGDSTHNSRAQGFAHRDASDGRSTKITRILSCKQLLLRGQQCSTGSTATIPLAHIHFTASIPHLHKHAATHTLPQTNTPRTSVLPCPFLSNHKQHRPRLTQCTTPQAELPSWQKPMGCMYGTHPAWSRATTAMAMLQNHAASGNNLRHRLVLPGRKPWVAYAPAWS